MSQSGISVTGLLPARVPLVSYPDFPPEHESLLKKHLNRTMWSNLKRKVTSKGGSVQCCIESGVKHLDPIGVLASDEEAYKTFFDLMEPIVKDLHPRFDVKYAYKLEELGLVKIESKIAEMQE